jgi:hypothetical protein
MSPGFEFGTTNVGDYTHMIQVATKMWPIVEREVPPLSSQEGNLLEI